MSQNININVKSATARLLATENIQVNQTNSTTAWFDVEKRVLNLPLWDVEPYVYDMLVGHEVGHALFTPADGWHQSIVDLGIPRSYINVVEDARIERMVKSKYPGIVNTFARAYSWMYDQDFFKIKGANVFSMNMIDRINLHFKLGASMTVPFAEMELPFIDKVAKCETFDDVVAVSKEILDFWKENKDEIKQELKEQQYDLMPEDADTDADDDEGEDLDLSSDSGEYEESDEESEESESIKTNGAGPMDDEEDTEEDVSRTDDALRASESKMLSSERGGIIKMFSEKMATAAMIPYKTYYAEQREVYVNRGYNLKFDRYAHTDPSAAYMVYVNELFKKFMNDTNRAVSYMAKEFEQKKAAYQYSRAKVSNSGTLNTTALHKYKFSEDVFKRITTLADAKSHGMVISVDMSGSMGNVMLDTFKQALNLAVFCRRVNIPFEMYGFTDGNDVDYYKQEKELTEGQIAPGGFRYIQFFSHKMNKREFDNAVKSVFMSGCGILNSYDRLGSTPTNEMLIALSYLLKKFRKETGVQKLMNIVLSDGDPNRSVINSGSGLTSYGNNYNLLQVAPTKVVRLYNTSGDLSEKLLNYIKTECNVINFGYFLGDNSTLKNTIYKITCGSYRETQEIKSNMRKNGGATVNNILGYDRYIVLKSSSIGIEDSEFEVAEDAKKSTIAREFAKFTKSKRTSRVLLDNFVQAVA